MYKANSLIRWLTLRDLYESPDTRKVIAFDAFGSFPDASLDAVESDSAFVKRFVAAGGDGLSVLEVQTILERKGFDNYQLVEGDVRETLPRYLSDNGSEEYCFVHLDIDVYEPTRMVLDAVLDRVVPGGLILIDDYGTVEGATEAVGDFLAEHPTLELLHTPLNPIPAYIRKP